MNTNKILVTGSAGFIGFYLKEKLCSLGNTVIGIDNLNDYYDVNLKYARLTHSGIEKNKIEYGKKIESTSIPGLSFIKLDLTDKEKINALFEKEKFDIVCNMAAQAGVRYSLQAPHSYIESNIQGFINILEACRHFPVKHLVYASSSSVYGMNKKIPFSVKDSVDNPVSLYAATKKSGELMAYTYSHLFNIQCTGLRFFTVYGPWGRPDMAYYKFCEKILKDEPIEVYNNGDMLRDFTFIDDIITGVIAAIERIPKNTPPYALYNLGNNKPVKLKSFIEILENALLKKAEKKYLEMQAGDVPATFADIKDTKKDLGWKPKTTLQDGLKSFVTWFYEYKNIG